jgi:hypothetical protein
MGRLGGALLCGNKGSGRAIVWRRGGQAGFLVDDIEAARNERARTPNVELLGELRAPPDGYAWQHFRAPDGYVYELTADPAAS